MEWRKRKPVWEYDEFDSPLEKIQKIRGISDVQEFLNPQKNVLHNQYKMKNIELASRRIIKAILNKENICISIDNDTDGVTSFAQKYRYLKNYTDKLTYIYAERSQGHGIDNQIKSYQFDEGDTEEIIKHKTKMVSNIDNADLLILIDSSTNDVDMCKKLKDKGKDIIILDHHSIEIENPYVILVNPQQLDCNYPNKHLSGAGVVFKIIEVIEEMLTEKGLSKQINTWDFCDLCAVGIYADVMKIDNLENRYLVMHGLRNIKNVGLARILKGGKQTDFTKLNSDSIGFTIAPMINGATRLDKIKLAIDILIEDDDEICKKLRLSIHKLNEERKVKQKEIAERYKDKIDHTKKVVFVADDFSSSGYNGLVATQLADEFKKNAIVGRLKDGTFSGSFRSYNDFDFKSFLQKFNGEITAVGHEGAGGIIIKECLLEKLFQYFEDNLVSDKNEPSIEYDFEIDVSEVSNLVNVMRQFNLLCGNGFPKITVKVNNITINERSVVGNALDTVKFTTMDDVELIKFKVNESFANELSVYSSISAIGVISLNEWYHRGIKQWVRNNQIQLLDYKCI